ncbi:MAG: 1,4-dihydroxy-2-naphthoate polyprenyltransferase [Flavobacteriaceae bacterium]|nr:1,4-dihydroxy-2-naphthoate polyprenyltransferase [Flavobacteriaceae bacterium]
MRHWIEAARLRTLPLSVSGIIVGTFLAADKGFVNLKITVLALLTTVGFQVLSNFANDYGDGVKGTDNDNRIGPKRAIQSGKISPRQMMKAIIITALITLIIAVSLIYIAFDRENFAMSLTFFLLGIASIAAAIKYTVGSKAYGYVGLGDLFVLIFFGWLSVVGSYFLYTKELDWFVFLPATSIGFLSMGVLNLNNMRDYESDKKSGKNTLIVKMGVKFGKIYHFILLNLAIYLALLYTLIFYSSTYQLLFLPVLIPLGIHVNKVLQNEQPKELDPELKKLAISTFLFSILFGLGLVFS